MIAAAMPLVLASVAALNLLIAFYVYRRNRTAAPNRAFALLAVAISVWAAAVAFSHHPATTHLWNLRLSFVAASLIPAALSNFALSIPPVSVGFPRLSRCVVAFLAIAFSIASLSPLLGTSLTPRGSGFTAVYGPLHRPFAVYVLLGFGYSIAILVLKHARSQGILRLQLRYLILAFSIPATLAVATNLLIPIFLGTSSLSRYGPLFSLLLLALVGHTIVRHRFMDIRIVVKRSAVYLIAAMGTGGLLILLILVANALMRDSHLFPYSEAVLALAAAALFAPLKRLLERATDRYLYREPYDYQRTVREASRTLADTIELEEILKYTSDLVRKTLQPTWIGIYLKSDEGNYEVGGGARDEGAPARLSALCPLAVHMARTRDGIYTAEFIVGGKYGRGVANEDVESDLRGLSIEASVPLLEEDGLVGILVLGQKQSGEPYYSDDADLLTTLSNHAAVAIRNAQAHQRVVLLNEELMKILGTIESGVIAATSGGKISLFNQAAEQLTGVEAAAVLGQPVDAVPAPIAGLLTAVLTEGAGHSQLEFTQPDATAQRRPLICSASPLLNPRGEVVGAVAVLGDLSRLKELERERNRIERLMSIEAIASGLVHEIRNPLVAIKTFSQLMPVRHQEPDFRDTFARVTGREIGRIEQLLDRFRTLASTSNQPMTQLDIREPIANALESLRPFMEERGIRLRQVADGTPKPVLGNASQLEQLFLNLCLNAIQAMEPAGELTIRVADLSAGGGSSLLVEVSDTGRGIPEDLLEKVFNPFVTTKPGGTGLGLAICRSIADAHHARLSARNNTERPGSTFTLEFPRPASEPARTRS